MTTFEVFTLFPDAIEGFVSAGLLGKAIDRGLVTVACTSYRDFATDKHRTVDDTPFGGGAGMVIKPEPVVAAIEHVEAHRGPMHRVLLTPSAPVFDQAAAARLASMPRVALLCGRYEGIDDRVREHYVDECLSLGDFVLGGGEVAALAIIEAVSRLLEGVLGNPDSVAHESFAPTAEGAWLEHPQYTRPADFRGHRVPAVLLGGDHQKIARWRREQSLRRTWDLRPDLRPARALPAATPIYLIVADPAAASREPLVAVARHHGVAGLLLHGADAEAAIPWAAASGGRPPAAAFADVRAIRRRLRRATGAEPWLVALVPDASPDAVRVSARGSAGPEGRPSVAGPPRLGSVAELLDALSAAGGPPGRPLALWLGEPGEIDAPPGACDAAWSLAAPEPALESGPQPGPPPDPRGGLALPTTIADVSQPAPPPAALADLALARLRASQRDTGVSPRSPS